MHKAIAHAMQGLSIELIATLEYDKAHSRPSHRLGNCFGVQGVILVVLGMA
jgi:hypothetical protein